MALMKAIMRAAVRCRAGSLEMPVAMRMTKLQVRCRTGSLEIGKCERQILVSEIFTVPNTNYDVDAFTFMES
ncbi:Uncharacterised protein [Yersinia intermedia]|jgi:hypothetical protein|nr:Uncharacterised protein [Yersinia intermedia]